MQIGQNQPSRSLVESKIPQPTQTGKKTQGALIIIDSFHSSTEHGTLVEATALAMGPTGQIHRYNHLQEKDGKASSPIHSAFLKMAEPMTGSLLPPSTAHIAQPAAMSKHRNRNSPIEARQGNAATRESRRTSQ